MTRSHQNDLKTIEPGDIVTLPDLPRDTLAFAITGSHAQGKHAAGLHYLTLRLIDKKGYTHKNKEGETYHLSRKDLADIKSVSGDAYKLDTSRAGVNKVIRLEFATQYYEFKEDAAEGIFFIRYAKTYGSHFGKHSLEAGVRALLKEQGVNPEAKSEYTPVTNSKPPETIRATRKASAPAVYDISVEDAHHVSFFQDERVYEALKCAGVDRLSTARTLADKKDPSLMQAWRDVTGRRAGFAEMRAEINDVWDEFSRHIFDERCSELEDLGVKVRYPVLSR